MHVQALLDDQQRISVVAIHNSDISDGWEREGEYADYFQGVLRGPRLSARHQPHFLSDDALTRRGRAASVFEFLSFEFRVESIAETDARPTPPTFIFPLTT